jgi:redox-sensitive bicupin YhaK (pirin superfamily)
MVDIRLASNAVFDQELPASYNGFLYPLEGEVLAGGSAQRLKVGRSDGWTL